MAIIVNTPEGSAAFEPRPSGGAFLNTSLHSGKALSLTLSLPQLIALYDDASAIIRRQTGAGTVPGCNGSYTCPAHFHADTCLLTPGN